MIPKNLLSVEQRLKLETLRRGANGAYAQIALLIILLIQTPHFPLRHWYQFFVTSLIFILAFRRIIYERLKHQPQALVSHFDWSIYLGLFTSVLWATVTGLAIWYFRITHPTGIVHVFITNGLLAAVMYSLSPTPKIQKLYVLILGLTITSILFFNETGANKNLFLPMLIFTMYLAFAIRSHSFDLRSAYEFEDKLVEENQKLEDVVDSVPGFMIITNEKGEWLHSSKSMGELFDSIELKTEISSFIESRLETRTKEIDFPIQGENSFVLKLEKRSKGSIVVLGLPIGEIKHMRTQLEQQKTKAEYSARLAALGEIAGGVAHEINNPLAVITMSADLLRNKLNAEKVSEGI